ncbi:hypothetical protein ACFW3Z_25700 [Nocardiopsis alba]|uniref:hypothetical protein n=1 Tax=Nocardiopsis alba TaxID=53437 RepID=UPI003671F037
MTEDAFHRQRLKALGGKVETALRHAGLTIFPAGEEGNDPGGAVVEVESDRVCVGWFTSDAFLDPTGDDREMNLALEDTMVRAMAGILTTMGYVVRVQPWQFDHDEPGISVAVVPSDQRKLGS